MKRTRRCLALLLAMLAILSVLPVSGLAASGVKTLKQRRCREGQFLIAASQAFSFEMNHRLASGNKRKRSAVLLRCSIGKSRCAVAPCNGSEESSRF